MSKEHSKGKKRKLVDEHLSDKVHDVLVTDIDTDPVKEYEVMTFIDPKENTDLNKDSSIVFEITTKANEFVRFNPFYQVKMDVSLTNQEYNDDYTTKKDLKLYLVTDDKVRFPVSTCALNIFKNVSVTYNNYLKDESVTFPQDGCFLNRMTAQDMLMSSERFQKYQLTFNNGSIGNGFLLSSLIEPYQTVVNSKIHKTYTDAPVIPDVVGNNNGGSKNGKIHYLYISRPPFQAVNDYMHRKYGLNSTIVFPPFSTIRIVFYKNDIPFKYLCENAEADTLAQIRNETFAGTNSFTKRALNPYIHSMQLAVVKTKVNPQKNKLPERHLHNIAINHFDVFELTNATTQRFSINWRTQETPLYLVLSFLREQDIVFNTTHELPQALNKFYLPRHLKSISIRQSDYANDVFDGIKIDNLDVNDYHPSKLQFFEYMKLHGFINRETKFEDIFSVGSGISSGFTNIFPINITGRQTSSKPHQEGLEVELQFRNPLTTKWYFDARYVFNSYFNFVKRANQKEYKIETNYM